MPMVQSLFLLKGLNKSCRQLGCFKKVSKLLELDQTLYSFRHSGAIEIYRRTGSLSKLQKAMGHSSLAVSLTYLRGLEVSELEESDMPMIQWFLINFLIFYFRTIINRIIQEFYHNYNSNLISRFCLKNTSSCKINNLIIEMNIDSLILF